MPQALPQNADLGPPGPFVLGTVQLGMPYGLGAASDGLDEIPVSKILSAAAKAGVNWLDTASAYGEAEARIGRWMAAGGGAFRIVAKLPALGSISDDEVPTAVIRALSQSHARIGVDRFDICLTHGAADFLRRPVIDALRKAKAGGLIGRYGASVYTIDQTIDAIAAPGIGALQVPLNVISHDIASAELVERAADQGVAVFARSVFLQGALLLPPEGLPPHLRELALAVQRLQNLARDAGVSLPVLLVEAVRRFPGVYAAVVGVDSAAQLNELTALAQARVLDQALIDEALAVGESVSSRVADPRLWPKP